MVRLGYNTNGFAHHRLEDCLEILAELGYRAVALTLDVGPLDPRELGPREVMRLRKLLEAHELVPVIETGGRYVLDPRKKHEPSLVSSDPAGRTRRLEFLDRAIRIASDLGSNILSFWAGKPEPGVSREACMGWLVEGCRFLAPRAEEHGIDLAFEPEPGMLVERTSEFPELARAVASPRFRLTIDVGHLLIAREIPIGDAIRARGSELVNVHIEDMPADRHEHVPFGEGDVPIDEALAALFDLGFQGPVTVELSRHSHLAPQAATDSKRFLDAAWDRVRRRRD